MIPIQQNASSNEPPSSTYHTVRPMQQFTPPGMVPLQGITSPAFQTRPTSLIGQPMMFNVRQNIPGMQAIPQGVSLVTHYFMNNRCCSERYHDLC